MPAGENVNRTRDGPCDHNRVLLQSDGAVWSRSPVRGRSIAVVYEVSASAVHRAGAHLTAPLDCDPLGGMEARWEEFERIVSAVLMRFARQSSRTAPTADVMRRFSTQLRSVLEARGLPRALREEESGAPGSMSEAECAPLVAEVIAGIDDAFAADAARQFVKACFYPEFKTCRDSYRESGRDGACRRQELERVRGRVSGAHCVDCPHWVALTPDAHVELLTREWKGDARTFAAHRDVFLPEDFRALRRWLYAASREGVCG